MRPRGRRRLRENTITIRVLAKDSVSTCSPFVPSVLVNHYDDCFALDLEESEKLDLVEYLKSLPEPGEYKNPFRGTDDLFTYEKRSMASRA